jgi:hypothetical protein
MESSNDLENNRRLALIEESISRTLLYNDNKIDNNNCNNLILSVTVVLSVIVISIIMVILIIVLHKIY